MISITNRIDAFVKLGTFISQFSREKIEQKDNVLHNAIFFEGFKHQLKLAQEHNQWFTKDNVLFALESWAKALTKDHLTNWAKSIDGSKNTSKTVAVIMAGNIPLVGFHDFLSVLISGHAVLVKQSSKDKHLLPYLAKYLEFCNTGFKDNITFTEQKLTNFDAIIATGSNNTARYFDYYFKDKPSIIRKNRNSVAVLTGKETEDQLALLSNDIFTYFGLGCRSVSKLFVPKNYNFDAFFRGMYNKKEMINNAKYANNYDYNKAVYLMSEFDLLENGFLMIKEDTSYGSPIATIFYEYYDNPIDLKIKLHQDKAHIQCVVATNFIEENVAFGATQHPTLWDYADNVNTLEFLANI